MLLFLEIGAHTTLFCVYLVWIKLLAFYLVKFFDKITLGMLLFVFALALNTGLALWVVAVRIIETDVLVDIDNFLAFDVLTFSRALFLWSQFGAAIYLIRAYKGWHEQEKTTNST